MQIPSVKALFSSRAGAAFGCAVAVRQSGAGGFAGQYARALGTDGETSLGAQQQMTITGGAKATVPVPLQTNPLLAEPARAASASADQGSPAPQVRSLSGGANTKWYVPSGAVSNTSGTPPLYIPAAGNVASTPVAGTGIDGRDIVEFAKQFVGTAYVTGGEDLEKGVDCSGFTQSVFKHFGIRLPRSAYRQSRVGTEVDPKDLKPGDLLFYKYDDYAPVTHVEIYIGDGKIIHAANKKLGVVIGKLKFGDSFVTARRMAP